MNLYRIKNWPEHYEVSQNKSVKKWSWVPLPIKHDGKGYRRVVARADGVAMLGAWMLIVQVAAKCPERGVLADRDGPLTAEDLAIKTGVPTPIFEEALALFCSERIERMLLEDAACAQLALPANDQTLGERSSALELDNQTIPNHTRADQRERKRPQFTPPTVEEVRAYCRERGYQQVDPQRFCDFYNSKGWMIGKNKMQNWKSSVSGWNSRERETQNAKHKSTAAHTYDPNADNDPNAKLG